MKYNRFEELPVWQAGVELAVRIFALTEDRAFRFRGDIASQLQRAALSVSNNVAEGFERGTTPELIAFIYIARGSAGEVRSVLCVVEKIPAFSHLARSLPEVKSLAESVSRQLRAWADSLQNSAIGGQRYLTDKSREAFGRRQRAAAFLAGLKEANAAAARKREKERQAARPAEWRPPEDESQI